MSNFREQSGAKITISSEQNCPERIVTISGGQNQIFKAVELITDKMFKVCSREKKIIHFQLSLLSSSLLFGGYQWIFR